MLSNLETPKICDWEKKKKNHLCLPNIVPTKFVYNIFHNPENTKGPQEC